MSTVTAAHEPGTCGEWSFATFGDDVDYTADRIGSIQRALRTSDNLDALYVVHA